MDAFMRQYLACIFFLCFAQNIFAEGSTLYFKSDVNMWGISHPFQTADATLIKVNEQQLDVYLTQGSHVFAVSDADNTLRYQQSEISMTSFNALLISRKGDLKVKPELRSSFYASKTGFYRIKLTHQPIAIEQEKLQLNITTTFEYIETPRSACLTQPPSQTPITIATQGVFKDGTHIQNAYTQEKAIVKAGKVVLPRHEAGLYLLEQVDAPPQQHVSNTIAYYVMLDRFENGDPTNDLSYGRKKDNQKEIATFHGGDLQGVLNKLDYIAGLGVNTLVISAPFEQIHGWVGAGKWGEHPMYAYHGFYVQDYTTIDKNFGTAELFKDMVAQAHEKGLKVWVNVAINHPGYATLQDMKTFGFGAVQHEDRLPKDWGQFSPKPPQTYHDFNKFVDYDNKKAWAKWWGKDWVRAGIAGYDKPNNENELMMSLYYLPDFKTESTKKVSLPPFLKTKAGTKAKDLPNATVSDYLVTWLNDWVAYANFDGLLLDAAKHVEAGTIQKLKKTLAGTYKKQNKQGDFTLIAEWFPHRLEEKTPLLNEFDGSLNFDLQISLLNNQNYCLPNFEARYQQYSQVFTPEFSELSFMSEYDVGLFANQARENIYTYQDVIAPVLLMPGNIQLMYGDESMRKMGPYLDDVTLGYRSDMNWADHAKLDVQSLIKHTQTLLNFRKQHPAIALGKHTSYKGDYYSFSRVLGEDKVLVVFEN